MLFLVCFLYFSLLAFIKMDLFALALSQVILINLVTYTCLVKFEKALRTVISANLLKLVPPQKKYVAKNKPS